jgi:fumarate hydratase, class I
VKLILKGGGCENMNAQYSLPASCAPRPRRPLARGVRKCILHAVWHAQGKGCAPGAVGVCIGGDRTSGYVHAKEQLFRTLDDVNPDERLAALEASIMGEVNGSASARWASAAACRSSAARSACSTACRRASSCRWRTTAGRSAGWASCSTRDRRDPRWLYRDPATPDRADGRPGGLPRTGREVALRTPLTEEQVRALKVGDVVLLSGRVYTGRDAVHHHLMSHEPPVDLRGGVIYHCGPVVAKDGDGWRVAAGPTTSIREEPYQADVIRRYGVRAVIGKGGMGARTLAALKEHGAVYLNAIGGAAQFYARAITGRGRGVAAGVRHARGDVAPALEDFPAIVTMDAHGNSLHKDVEQASARELEPSGLYKAVFSGLLDPRTAPLAARWPRRV